MNPSSTTLHPSSLSSSVKLKEKGGKIIKKPEKDC